jgi:hypothetical protein
VDSTGRLSVVTLLSCNKAESSGNSPNGLETSGRIIAIDNDLEHRCLPSREIAIKVVIPLARQF